MNHFNLKKHEEIEKSVSFHTQKKCEDMALFLAEKKIKLDKNDFMLTDFVRENFIFFEEKLNAICNDKMEFIISFLFFHGYEIKKETLRTIYSRVEKEKKNEQ